MSTDTVRYIDDLGRIVIPREIRRAMGISDGDPLEIEIKHGKIILSKYQRKVPLPSELVREASARLNGINNVMSDQLYKIAEELKRDEL